MDNYRRTTGGTVLSIPGPHYNPYHTMQPLWRDLQLRCAMFENIPNLRTQMNLVRGLLRELDNV